MSLLLLAWIAVTASPSFSYAPASVTVLVDIVQDPNNVSYCVTTSGFYVDGTGSDEESFISLTSCRDLNEFSMKRQPGLMLQGLEAGYYRVEVRLTRRGGEVEKATARFRVLEGIRGND